jgi:Arc/MetJ-type ribon-helix-helix transcriptional regulator
MVAQPNKPSTATSKTLAVPTTAPGMPSWAVWVMPGFIPVPAKDANLKYNVNLNAHDAHEIQVFIQNSPFQTASQVLRFALGFMLAGRRWFLDQDTDAHRAYVQHFAATLELQEQILMAGRVHESVSDARKAVMNWLGAENFQRAAGSALKSYVQWADYADKDWSHEFLKAMAEDKVLCAVVRLAHKRGWAIPLALQVIVGV